MWTTYIIVTTIWAVGGGQRLYPCDDLGYREVVENTPVTFYCDQYTGQSVTWEYKSPSSNSSAYITECGDTGCTANSFYTVTFISAGNSSVTTPLTSRTHGGGEIQCGLRKCLLHVVVPAEVSAPTAPNITRQDSGYTVSVSADVTKVYSSRGDYFCRLQLGSTLRITTPNLDPPARETSNTSDRSGSCDVTLPLPNNTGTYPCSVTVSPGNTEMSCDSVNITRPSPPTFSCPSDVIAENTSVNCACDTSNIGQPGGRLRWNTGTGSDVSTEVVSGAYDVSSLTMTWPSVTRNDHNVRKFRCVNKWTVTILAQNDYTALVAWGPDAVSIQGNTTFYTDTTGSLSLNLNCQPSQVNPAAALTYRWNGPCDVTGQSTCTFKPRPPGPGDSGDDNREITCTVTNVKNNNRQQQGSVTLDLKYPPGSPPRISGYVSGHVLYEGDSLTLTCTVTGGDPEVTSVSWSCPGQPSIGRTSSSLEISRLTESHHGLTCVCRGDWVKTSYYTLTDNRTLTVYYSPSPPTITRTDGGLHPPLQGDTVTLQCSLTSPGNPTAEVTWPSEGSNVKDNPLQWSVKKTDNKRSFTCEASNAFTQDKGTQLRDSYTLTVYYGPSITLRAGSDNICQMTSDNTSCNVTEGRRVHLLCDVDSNPAPQSCTWRVLSGSSTIPGPDLDIVSASRNHSGVYQVRVETTKPNNSDDRLPRMSQRNITVLVTYQPTSPQLMVNNKINVTVNENEAVTLECQSRGRPTPGLELSQRDKQLASQKGGQLSLSEEITQLSHSTVARCSNTGTFTCNASNGVGDVQPTSVQLYVNCKPRATTTEPEPELPHVNFKNTPVTVVFDLEAFPLPDIFTFQYLGSTQNFSNSKPASGNIDLRVTCTNTHADFAVTCNVSVHSVKDSSAAGFYTLTAANTAGQGRFVFQVKVNDTAEPFSDEGLDVVPIVAGLVAALLVIAIVIAVVFIIRKRRPGKGKSESRNGRNARREEPDMIVNDLYGTGRRDDDDEVMVVNDLYETSGRPNDEQETMIVNDMYESSGPVAPRPTASGMVASSAYEDVTVGATANPVIQPQPGPSTSNESNVYAVVNRANRTSPPAEPAAAAAAAAVEEANVYAVVDRSRKNTAAAPPPAEGATSRPARPAVAPRPAPQRREQPRPNHMEMTEESVYNNTGPTPGPSNEAEGTLYQNFAFQHDDTDPDTALEVAEEGDESRTVNADGLVYSTVAFTESQRQKEKEPNPEREDTNYAGLDFVLMAREAAKRRKEQKKSK